MLNVMFRLLFRLPMLRSVHLCHVFNHNAAVRYLRHALPPQIRKQKPPLLNRDDVVRPCHWVTAAPVRPQFTFVKFKCCNAFSLLELVHFCLISEVKVIRAEITVPATLTIAQSLLAREEDVIAVAEVPVILNGQETILPGVSETIPVAAMARIATRGVARVARARAGDARGGEWPVSDWTPARVGVHQGADDWHDDELQVGTDEVGCGGRGNLSCDGGGWIGGQD